MDSSLLSNIQKLFYERIEVFATVEFFKLSIVTGIIKIVLKVHTHTHTHTVTAPLLHYISHRLSWSVCVCGHLASLVYSRCRWMHTTCKYTSGDLSPMSSE